MIFQEKCNAYSELLYAFCDVTTVMYRWMDGSLLWYESQKDLQPNCKTTTKITIMKDKGHTKLSLVDSPEQSDQQL